MTVHFRIRWFPIGFRKSKIRSFLANDADYIEVIDIEHEKWSHSDILNGDIKVKANIDVDRFYRFRDFAGVQIIEKLISHLVYRSNVYFVMNLDIRENSVRQRIKTGPNAIKMVTNIQSILWPSLLLSLK